MLLHRPGVVKFGGKISGRGLPVWKDARQLPVQTQFGKWHRKERCRIRLFRREGNRARRGWDNPGVGLASWVERLPFLTVALGLDVRKPLED